MVAAPEYSLQTQAKIPLALGSLHNFIRITDPDDEALHEDDHEDDGGHIRHEINPEHLGQHISQAEKDRASMARDEIAKAMWEDYQRVLADREGLSE
jgi:hypothetical protein